MNGIRDVGALAALIGRRCAPGADFDAETCARLVRVFLGLERLKNEDPEQG